MEERYGIGSPPFPGMPASVAATIRPEMVEPSSPEDGTNLNSSLQIDMKLHMGDAVGNVSPTPPLSWRPLDAVCFGR